MEKDHPTSTEILLCENRNRPEDPAPDHVLRAPKTGVRLLRNAFFTVFYGKKANTGKVVSGRIKKAGCGEGPNDQGSLSIEAACAVPLFLMLVFALLSFFSVIQTELLVGSALSDTARELSRTCDPEFSEKAPAMVLQALSENGGDRGDFNGKSGLDISCGQFGTLGEEYRITASCPVGIPFFSTVSERFKSEISVSSRSFSGKTFTEEIGGQPVYVTEYGRVYHTSINCRVLRPSVTAVDVSALSGLRNKDGKIYYPCGICGSGPRGGQVFVTDYGTSWHSDRSCAGLRRGIRRIPLSEAGERSLCSFCREKDGE